MFLLSCPEIFVDANISNSAKQSGFSGQDTWAWTGGGYGAATGLLLGQGTRLSFSEGTSGLEVLGFLDVKTMRGGSVQGTEFEDVGYKRTVGIHDLPWQSLNFYVQLCSVSQYAPSNQTIFLAQLE